MTQTTLASGAKRALLLIDFQDDFLGPKGRMPVCRDHVGPALAAARRAVAQARRRGDAILAIGNEFKPDDHLMNLLRRRASIAGSTGARWSPALPLEGIPYLAKWATSAFVNPDLDAWLRDNGIKTLSLTGLKAGACISETAKEALARGYEVDLIAEAIACDSDESRRRALARLERRGARVVKVGELEAAG